MGTPTQSTGALSTRGAEAHPGLPRVDTPGPPPRGRRSGEVRLQLTAQHGRRAEPAAALKAGPPQTPSTCEAGGPPGGGEPLLPPDLPPSTPSSTCPGHRGSGLGAGPACQPAPGGRCQALALLSGVPGSGWDPCPRGNTAGLQGLQGPRAAPRAGPGGLRPPSMEVTAGLWGPGHRSGRVLTPGPEPPAAEGTCLVQSPGRPSRPPRPLLPMRGLGLCVTL